MHEISVVYKSCSFSRIKGQIELSRYQGRIWGGGGVGADFAKL